MKIRFSLNVKEAKKLLAPIIKNINTSTVLPILESILVEAKEGKIKFSATDLQTTTACTFNYHHDGGGLFIIDGKALKKLLTNAIAPELIFTSSGDSTTIQCGEYSLTMSDIDSANNYPKYPELNDIKNATVDTKDIIPFITQAIPFISNDDLRPAMTGVYLHDNKGELTIAATDAHRLYFYGLMKTPSSLKDATCIINKKACVLLSIIFTTGQITIKQNGTHIMFSNNQYELICRLIDATYPDYTKVIPKNDLEVIVNRKQLKSFLKLANGFVNKSTQHLELELTGDKLKIKGGDVDFSQIFYYSMPIIKANLPIGSIPFAVNCFFLNSALDVFPKNETVKIKHSKTATKAMIIDDCILLMPLLSNS